MKIKIICMIIFILFVIPVISTSAVANQNAKLEAQIYGGFPMPMLIRNVGGVIVNTGNTTAYNLSYTLSIIGGTYGSINYTSDGFIEDLDPFDASGKSVGVFTPEIFGFGIVTITLYATAINADDLTVRANGIQFGDITWVPLSWIAPPILKGLIPWLDY